MVKLLEEREINSEEPCQSKPAEMVEKMLYLRRKYHLGPIRSDWHSARFPGIKISGVDVYHILKSDCLIRLPDQPHLSGPV